MSFKNILAIGVVALVMFNVLVYASGEFNQQYEVSSVENSANIAVPQAAETANIPIDTTVEPKIIEQQSTNQTSTTQVTSNNLQSVLLPSSPSHNGLAMLNVAFEGIPQNSEILYNDRWSTVIANNEVLLSIYWTCDPNVVFGIAQEVNIVEMENIKYPFVKLDAPNVPSSCDPLTDAMPIESLQAMSSVVTTATQQMIMRKYP
jgi:hypothetical protein